MHKGNNDQRSLRMRMGVIGNDAPFRCIDERSPKKEGRKFLQDFRYHVSPTTSIQSVNSICTYSETQHLLARTVSGYARSTFVHITFTSNDALIGSVTGGHGKPLGPVATQKGEGSLTKRD